MSESFGCKCEERKKPISLRKWVVWARFCNHAFNGYKRAPSKYSTVLCLVWNAMGRTKASYVKHLPDSNNVNEGFGSDGAFTVGIGSEF